MNPRDLAHLLPLAALVAVGCGNVCELPNQGVEHPWSLTRSGTVSAATGGSVVVEDARVDVPAGALPRDLDLTLTIHWTSVHAHVLPDRVILSPGGVALATPGTLSVPLSAAQQAAPGTLTAALQGGDALRTEVVDDALVVTFSETGTILFGEGPCSLGCTDGRICHGGTCVAECDSNDDCPEVRTCGVWLDSSILPRRRCDTQRGVCVDDGHDVTPCDGCDIETGACFPPGACPPPQRGWPGERGICLCGFPELFCAEPPEVEGEPDAWVDAPCDADTDCDGCSGQAMCLRPGQRYPDPCFEQGMLRCYYEPSAPPGSCAAMCEE